MLGSAYCVADGVVLGPNSSKRLRALTGSTDWPRDMLVRSWRYRELGSQSASGRCGRLGGEGWDENLLRG